MVLTMSYCCSAANDKATAQKQMTENYRHHSEVFAKYSRQTVLCHHLSQLQIQGSPLQLFIQTTRTEWDLY